MIAPWFIWTLFAVFCWGIWALLSRSIGDALTPGQSQALSTLGLIPVLAGLFLSKRLGTCSRKGCWFAFVSGILTALGNVAYYALLNSGAKAVTVVPLTALYPLVTVLLAVVFLKEKLNKIQIGGVALSLASIYLFNVPEEKGVAISWLAFALLPIALWGLSGLLQKVATNSISGELSTLWFLIAFVPVACLLLWKEPMAASPTGRIWALVLLLGFSFAVGNLALLLAFARNGKASIIAPLAGLYPLVSIPMAMIQFSEKVGPREGLGIALALLAVSAISIESRPA